MRTNYDDDALKENEKLRKALERSERWRRRNEAVLVTECQRLLSIVAEAIEEATAWKADYVGGGYADDILSILSEAYPITEETK